MNNYPKSKYVQSDLAKKYFYVEDKK